MIPSDETADDSPCHDLPDDLSARRVILTESVSPRRWLLADATTPLLGALVATAVPVPAAVFPVALGFFSGLFVYAASTNLLPRVRMLPVSQGVPATLGGAAAMFVVSRLA